MAASVVMIAIIVPRSGRIIPAPFAMPPTRTSRPSISTVRVARLGCESVVQIAIARRARRLRSTARRRRRGCRPRRGPSAAARRSRRSSRPARRRPAPVSSPVSAAIRSASARPCAPVATFALPLEITIARAVALAARRSRQRRTGAPAARLRVKTPAAVAGPSAHHERDVRPARGLDPARRSRRPEAARVRDAYGHRARARSDRRPRRGRASGSRSGSPGRRRP